MSLALKNNLKSEFVKGLIFSYELHETFTCGVKPYATPAPLIQGVETTRQIPVLHYSLTYKRRNEKKPITSTIFFNNIN